MSNALAGKVSSERRMPRLCFPWDVGAAQYGGVEQQFTITERDGRLYLGKDKLIAPVTLARVNGRVPSGAPVERG